MKMILLGTSLLYLASCAGKQIPEYMRSHEERVVCHKKYRSAEWWPVQIKLPIYLAYNDHITMHPNDYWGRCKEEIRPIPDISAWPMKNPKGEWLFDKKKPKPMKGKRGNNN